MHWGTYRATLRRHGTFRQDLNVELVSPMTKNIASSWAQIFEADLFANFQKTVMESVDRLTKDVEDTAAKALRDRVKNQAELCLDEARLALQNAIDIVKETLNAEQKDISRCFAPHVQNELVDGYDLAMEERGRGSVARQKVRPFACCARLGANCVFRLFSIASSVKSRTTSSTVVPTL